MKGIVQRILALFARITIARFKPRVIGVTGSVGKTTTKEAIALVLSRRFNVNKSEGNLNNEFGLPLTILGLRPAHSAVGWLFLVIVAFFKTFFRIRYYDVLVLEYGIDHPGDMKYLTGIVAPHVAVVTAVESVHLEFFHSVEGLTREKEQLLDAVTPGGLGLVNFDNPYTREMLQRHPSLTMSTFGSGEGSNLRVTNIESHLEKTVFNLAWKDLSLSVILNVPGAHHVSCVLPAIAIGQHFGIPVDEILASLYALTLPPGRLTVLKGTNGSILIDSTYNAEPASMKASLDYLGHQEAKKKIVVLGDMLELGKTSMEAHLALLDEVTKVSQAAILIGPEMKKLYVAMTKEYPNFSVRHFDHSDEAIPLAQEMVSAGDLVLLKGSQGVRIEKITKALLANPSDAQKLVRQSDKWLNN